MDKPDLIFYHLFSEALNEGKDAESIEAYLERSLVKGVIDFKEYDICRFFLEDRERRKQK